MFRTKTWLAHTSTALSSARRSALFSWLAKFNLSSIRGTSSGFETSADYYLTRRIQFWFHYFCTDPVITCFKKWEVKNEFYKNSQKADLDFPRRELSDGGLKCHSLSGSLANWFFVGSYWMPNLAVQIHTIHSDNSWYIWLLIYKPSL